MTQSEGTESSELFSATLGFDFVFSKDQTGAFRCYCVEFNGHDAGVGGVKDIPDGQIDSQHKVMAQIRNHRNPKIEHKMRIAEEIIEDLKTGAFDASNDGQEKVAAFLHKSMDTNPLFTHAHHNPEFVETIAEDKRLQEKYIPEENRPRYYHERESPISSTGLWVVKRYDSRAGQKVFIINNSEFQKQFITSVDLLANYVAQEFIPSSGAQILEEAGEKRAASMRLLMDFRFLQNGQIKTDFETAYQRVAPYGMDQTANSEGRPLSLQDRYVVSRNKAARSVAASPEELEMARAAAKKIIENLATGYRKDFERKKR